MRLIVVTASVTLVVAALFAADSKKTNPKTKTDPAPLAAVTKGAEWLISVQGKDGGWGQDGGDASNVRQGERMESNGNDVTNTAVAAMALLKAGKKYQPNVERAVVFILDRVEASPVDTLAVTDIKNTQIQRKLGPYIDTFMTSMLLSQVDGKLSSMLNVRVRKSLEKTVAKIQKNQKSDGSWNTGGGWAPVLGTSMASRSLYEAQQKGVAVDNAVMLKADAYSVAAMGAPAGLGATGGAVSSVTVRGSASMMTDSAGVQLYQSAQALEQLSRTAADRAKNADAIQKIQGQMKSAQFVNGFGSMGGEEFFSYLNLSDGMKRTGGEAWTKWHDDITKKVLALQNGDGTWSGHHCITGRVAVTSAAMLNLSVEQ
jgi:hypothetical protein